jgi:antitoxin FitA
MYVRDVLSVFKQIVGENKMAQLLVRDLSPAVVARLKDQARQNHRSLQGEVKAILEEAAQRATRDEALAMIDKWQRKWGERVFSDSTQLIREDRDQR